uniref:Uncharacterized protein n=1 Tax=Rhizophora mucronata TaxID=61149 RepID=A0A2P2P2M2_RHIMU
MRTIKQGFVISLVYLALTYVCHLTHVCHYLFYGVKRH